VAWETYGRRFRRGQRPAPNSGAGSETRAEQWGGVRDPRRTVGRGQSPAPGDRPIGYAQNFSWTPARSWASDSRA
jgi:hypothetical protein